MKRSMTYDDVVNTVLTYLRDSIKDYDAFLNISDWEEPERRVVYDHEDLAGSCIGNDDADEDAIYYEYVLKIEGAGSVNAVNTVANIFNSDWYEHELIFGPLDYCWPGVCVDFIDDQSDNDDDIAIFTGHMYFVALAN